MQRPSIEKPDIAEHGARGATSDRRLFMQFRAYGDCDSIDAAVDAMKSASIEGVVYEDVNDPFGLGVLGISEDPAFFVGPWRDLLRSEPFAMLDAKHELTMLGRTYAIGYEADLDQTLIHRPRHTALNPDWTWALWYPLRRRGSFTQLPDDEQREILAEHGRIGMAFGSADYAHDIRLLCHGLDREDNDFVVGLVGRELYPLSAVVQTMRKTKQTSTYLERLGPFFVGHVLWQSPLEPDA
jgi:chlorite dismutase